MLGEGSKTERRNPCLRNNDNHENRVLNRIGARKLNDDEIKKVTGGRVPTLASVIFTNGGKDETLDT